jgi:hypothetical protein
MEQSIEDRCDALFEKLVPSEGKADTVEGEMIRAICRIGYRWSNDGDYFYEGYGAETAGPAHEYLISHTPIKSELFSIFRKALNKREEEYEAVIDAAVKVVVEYVEAHLNNTTPNTRDLLDCKSRYYHEDDPNEDEDEEW